MGEKLALKGSVDVLALAFDPVTSSEDQMSHYLED